MRLLILRNDLELTARERGALVWAAAHATSAEPRALTLHREDGRSALLGEVSTSPHREAYVEDAGQRQTRIAIVEDR